ncbi:hypothetical protein [Paremcibacter congregatus]|uniref:hypothetical protein n=1 Tax=Paremcibacter congregatus TaxID=2043170 RepID=UPI0030EF14CE|tara:strand:- start:1287 stop:1511 length:225 start_codon:yes stop_codon:yes gene_type:complete
MTSQHTSQKLHRPKSLDKLATPEEVAYSLQAFYKNPFMEMQRRKKIAVDQGHSKNIQFWKNVEHILHTSHNSSN